MKNSTKKIILTKNGKVSKNITNMLNNCIFDTTNNKIYTGYYSGSGRFTSSHSAIDTILPILNAEKLKFTKGNDAPKGGAKGEYLKLSKTAFNFILNLKNI